MTYCLDLQSEPSDRDIFAEFVIKEIKHPGAWMDDDDVSCVTVVELAGIQSLASLLAHVLVGQK